MEAVAAGLAELLLWKEPGLLGAAAEVDILAAVLNACDANGWACLRPDNKRLASLSAQVRGPSFSLSPLMGSLGVAGPPSCPPGTPQLRRGLAAFQFECGRGGAALLCRLCPEQVRHAQVGLVQSLPRRRSTATHCSPEALAGMRRGRHPFWLGRVPPLLTVNTVLQGSKAFRQAFKCP